MPSRASGEGAASNSPTGTWPHSTRSRPSRCCSTARRTQRSSTLCRHAVSAPGGTPKESNSTQLTSCPSKAAAIASSAVDFPTPLAPVNDSSMRASTP
jgi:hypothetical protein